MVSMRGSIRAFLTVSDAYRQKRFGDFEVVLVVWWERCHD
jgi:hypothetical protein